MNVYSVTLEWETERESQMVETVAVIAAGPTDAEITARQFIENRTGCDPEVTRMSDDVHFQSRVIAELAIDADDRPYWVNR